MQLGGECETRAIVIWANRDMGFDPRLADRDFLVGGDALHCAVKACGVKNKEITMSAAQATSPLTDTKLDQLCVNTIRTLSIDAVQQAKSGHPGTPMALAPLVYTIWNRVLRFDPQESDLAQSGSLRSIERSCFDVALVSAPSEWHASRERRI